MYVFAFFFSILVFNKNKKNVLGAYARIRNCAPVSCCCFQRRDYRNRFNSVWHICLSRDTTYISFSCL